MNEGVGSSTILIIIVVFIVFVFGYIAFNVNYSKAFHMKDKIIRTYEKYDGQCYNYGNGCIKEITDYAKQIGYTAYRNLDCDTAITKIKMKSGSLSHGQPIANLYCEYDIDAYDGSGVGVVQEGGTFHYYKIMTRINIEIPIIQNILSHQILTVTGDTKLFKRP